MTAAVTWHVKALVIRLRLGVPQAGTICAASPHTAASLALSCSAACLPRPPVTLIWLRRSHPCSTNWRQPTAAGLRQQPGV